MTTPPTTEDRIWAVLSHLSALAFGMGIALPVVGWSDQRRKSNYAAFQSLQALGYQSLGFTVWALSCLLVIVVAAFILLLLLGPENRASARDDMQMRAWIIVISVLLLGLLAVYIVLPVIAAVACLLGRDFRYPILGNRLARYLKYQPFERGSQLDGDHEFRWIAAMGHFSILIILWGILAPLLAWILQGRQHRFLRFQSIQTLIYQSIATTVYLVAMILYLLGVGLILAGLERIEQVSFATPTGILGMILFAASVGLSSLLLLMLPLLHILGQWAGYRILKGDDYRYPLIGQLVQKHFSKRFTAPEDSH